MLTRWDPFSEMNRIQDEFVRSTLSRNGSKRTTFAPAVDVFEDAEAIYLKAELPGLSLENVNVGVENDVLTLAGERMSEREEGHFIRERWCGPFSRSFKLPRTVDVERIEATLKDGILSVRLPKRDSVKLRKVEIKS